MPETPVRRRTFVAAAATATTAVAALGAAGTSPALATTATALARSAPDLPADLDRAAGVVQVGGVDRVLSLRGSRWGLADDGGGFTPVAGLEGAEVVDTATGPFGAVAAGSLAGAAVIWESADGLTWVPAVRRNEPAAVFTAVGAGPDAVLVLGSLLSAEGVPRRAVVAHKTRRGWVTVPARGLGGADRLPVTAVVGDGSGWTAAAVGMAGTVLFHSPDGTAWTGGGALADAAVRELRATGSGVRWFGNAVGDTAPLTGLVGGGRSVAAVPVDAHAVGAGTRSFWLSGGRLVAAEA